MNTENPDLRHQLLYSPTFNQRTCDHDWQPFVSDTARDRVDKCTKCDLVARLLGPGTEPAAKDADIKARRDIEVKEYLDKTKLIVDQIQTLERRIRECNQMVILLDRYIKGGWHAPEVRVQPGMGTNLEPEDHNVVKVRAEYMRVAVLAQLADYQEALDTAVAKLLGYRYGG